MALRKSQLHPFDFYLFIFFTRVVRPVRFGVICYSRRHCFPYLIHFPSLFFFLILEQLLAILLISSMSLCLSYMFFTYLFCFLGKFFNMIFPIIELLFNYIHPLTYSIYCAPDFKIIFSILIFPLGQFFKNFIALQLTYNVVLVLGIQQNESIIRIHISIPSQILFPFRALHSIEQMTLCSPILPAPVPNLPHYPFPLFELKTQVSMPVFSGHPSMQSPQIQSETPYCYRSSSAHPGVTAKPTSQASFVLPSSSCSACTCSHFLPQFPG